MEDSISGKYHRMQSDEERVKQVLLNLVLNAVNDSKNGGTVSLDIFIDDGTKSEMGRLDSSSLLSTGMSELTKLDKQLVCSIKHEQNENSD